MLSWAPSRAIVLVIFSMAVSGERAWAQDEAPSGGSSGSGSPYTPPLSAKSAKLPEPGPTKREGRLSAPEILPLETRVNGQDISGIFLVEIMGDVIVLEKELWDSARFIPAKTDITMSNGTIGYSIGEIAGSKFNVDRNSMRLEITAPTESFNQQVINLSKTSSTGAEPIRDYGFLLNYDLSMSLEGGKLGSHGGLFDLTSFGPYGRLSSSAAVLSRSTGGYDAQRLDTFWQYDLPGRMETVVVGDSIAAGGAWSHPARFTGIRYSRNFSLRPEFLTAPTLSFPGQAALPSTVDVLLNDSRRSRSSVQSGPFTVDNLPLTNGAGQVNLVVRDLLGRESVYEQSYYASSSLLKAGLHDYSFEAGWLRYGIGDKTTYGDPFVTATFRTGLTSWLTAEGRLEAQEGRGATGLNVTSLAGDLGVLRASIAHSASTLDGPMERGQLLQLGFERTSKNGGINVQYESASKGFSNFGEEQLSQSPRRSRTREQWLLSGSLQLGNSSSISANYVSRRLWDGSKVANVGAYLNVPFVQKSTLSFGFSRQLSQKGGWSGGMQLTVPLGGTTFASARTDVDSTGLITSRATASSSAALESGNSISWNVQSSAKASYGNAAKPHESALTRGSVQYLGETAEVGIDAQSGGGLATSARLNLRGTAGFVGTTPFATRPSGDGAVAIVQVPGAPNVEVKHMNKPIGKTDANGNLVVPYLFPWSENKIEIDGSQLPLDYELKETMRTVTPHARTGAIVRFDVKQTLSFLAAFQLPDGSSVPSGAKVQMLPDGDQFTVGRRGEAWFSGLPMEKKDSKGDQEKQNFDLMITWADKKCIVTLPAINPSISGERVGPFVCNPATPMAAELTRNMSSKAQ